MPGHSLPAGTIFARSTCTLHLAELRLQVLDEHLVLSGVNYEIDRFFRVYSTMPAVNIAAN